MELKENEFLNILDAVEYADSHFLNFRIDYQNDKYVVVEVKS